MEAWEKVVEVGVGDVSILVGVQQNPDGSWSCGVASRQERPVRSRDPHAGAFQVLHAELLRLAAAVEAGDAYQKVVMDAVVGRSSPLLLKEET